MEQWHSVANRLRTGHRGASLRITKCQIGIATATRSGVATEIAKAGLLGELGNSFLVIAEREEAVVDDPPWLVWSERLTKNSALCSITTLENDRR